MIAEWAEYIPQSCMKLVYKEILQLMQEEDYVIRLWGAVAMRSVLKVNKKKKRK